MTTQKTNIDLVSALSSQSLNQRKSIDSILKKKRVANTPTTEVEIPQENTNEVSAKKTVRSTPSNKQTAATKKKVQTSDLIVEQTPVDSNFSSSPLEENSLEDNSSPFSPLDFSNFTVRVDFLRKQVKLDKRVLDELIKNTLYLNLPLYRIVELIVIEFCQQNYPQSDMALHQVLNEFHFNKSN